MHHENRDALADDLAHRLVALLCEAVDQRGHASLVVSGGSTPLPLFRRLRTIKAPWSQVTVVMADERWVAIDDPRSNEGLIRKELLCDRAAKAILLALDQRHLEIGDASEHASKLLRASLPDRFDAVVLGMGTDGHFASLFPRSPGLAQALQEEGAHAYLAMEAASDPKDRLSLNLPRLLHTRSLFLHVTGDEKRSLLANAQETSCALPIRALVRQRIVPLEIYWAP